MFFSVLVFIVVFYIIPLYWVIIQPLSKLLPIVNFISDIGGYNFASILLLGFGFFLIWSGVKWLKTEFPGPNGFGYIIDEASNIKAVRGLQFCLILLILLCGGTQLLIDLLNSNRFLADSLHFYFIEILFVISLFSDLTKRDQLHTEDIGDIDKDEEPRAEETEEKGIENAKKIVEGRYTWEFNEESYLVMGQAIKHTVDLSIDMEKYNRLHNRPRVNFNKWADEYVKKGITDEISELTSKIRLINYRYQYSYYNQINNVIAFVHQFKYQSDLEGTGKAEYPKYPIETLVEETGDCEDFSFLTAAILKKSGFDTILLNPPEHIAVGVAGADGMPGAEGAYVHYQGKKYYYCETTSEGWCLGMLPEHYQGSNVRVIPL